MDSATTDTSAAGPRPTPAASRPPLASFLEHLVKTGVITRQQAVEAAEWKARNDKDKRGLAEILEEVYGVPRDPLRQGIAQFYAFRTVTLAERSVRKLLTSDVNKILRSLPEPTLQQLLKCKLLPFDLAENQPEKIVLVTPNPADREIHDLARAFPYKWYEVCYMKESEWTEYWGHLTSGRDREQADQTTAPANDGTLGDFEAGLDREIARGKIAAQLDNVFLDALRTNATEIHFVPRAARKTEVLFRLDGHLASWHTIDEVRCEAVAAALKELAVGVDRYERQGSQQGVIQRSVENNSIRFTVSVLPVISRDIESRLETIVLRVFRDADHLPRLDHLGLNPYASRTLQTALTASRGLILFAGTARSGASMLQIAALRSVLTKTLNVVIVQDQTQYIIEGARQVRLSSRLTAQDALATISEQDPDLVVLGDLTSRTVADIAIRMANIGHLVLATLPSRTAIKALGSLVSTTGELYPVAEAVTAVMAQQPIRLLCERCKKEMAPAAAEEAKLRLRDHPAPSTLYRGVGCIDCQAGYGGKRVLFEALAMTHAVRCILLHADRIPDEFTLETAAVQDGMMLMRRQALDLLQNGSTTVDEVLPFIL